MLASLSRLVSGHAVINSMIVPCSIHSEIIIKVCEDFVAPINGNRFGCLNCFHRTTSRQKLCFALVSTRRRVKKGEGRTLSTLIRSNPEWTRNTLIATLELWYTPRHTSALPPPTDGSSPTLFSPLAMVYEVGNNLCSRHIFRSTI